jgi:Zn-dependent M32 family carboxypeptidase
VNNSLSMGVHESQSLLWERMVALGRPFAEYLLPKLQVSDSRSLQGTAVQLL